MEKDTRPPNALEGKGKVPIGPEMPTLWSFTHAGPQSQAKDFDNSAYLVLLSFIPFKNGAA